jgi:hypothetical protein
MKSFLDDGVCMSAVGLAEDVGVRSTAELAEALAAWGCRAAAAECRWLRALAEFDRRQGWAADGQLTAVDWLAWRCGLARRTARDKLRVAHELRRRPLVAEAFAAGSLSYCKVRAICRITDVDEACDRQLVAFAAEATVAQLERVVRHWEHLRDQERDLDDYLARWDRRGLVASRTHDGMVHIDALLGPEEGEEVLAALDASEAEAQPGEEAVDGGSREPHPLAERRADALLALVRGRSAGSERYTVHLVSDLDALAGRLGARAELLGGEPLDLDTLRRIACDCGIVRHLLRGGSEPLDVGRRTAVWTAAQRRAIAVRDHGRCRFVACERRTCDIHHIRHFADGGPTAVSNGCLLCPRHHTAVHERGFTITGDPNSTLTFFRPDGTILGTTRAGPPDLPGAAANAD